jgi:putative hemin transport protein
MGQFTGSRIDLRIFLRNWHHGYATRVATARGEVESLQFFDSDGVAVHKIYLREESDDSAWKSLIERHTASDQTPRLDGMTPDPFATRLGSIPSTIANGESDSSGARADDGVEAASRSLSDEREVSDVESSSSRTELDSAAFLSEWEGMKDTHEFVPLLRRHGLTRRTALELATGRFSREVALDAALAIFAELSRQDRKCMVFVGNHGCLQIHSGPIRRVVETPGWLNVMDPGFNLHLHRAQASAAYVVRKPSESGMVTSLEIFGADPEPLALLFSYRKGGEKEERGWVDLLAGIPNS